MNWFKKFLTSLNRPVPDGPVADTGAAGNTGGPARSTTKLFTRVDALINFTPHAQQVLALGRREADRLNHNFLGTEHLLLGLIRFGQGTAVKVLVRKGLELETLRQEVEKFVGTGPDQKMIGKIPYTPRFKKVIALAEREAKQFNHTYVGTEHLLLGLLREGDGVAARILRNFDVGLEQTRQDILRELDQNTTAENSGDPEGTRLDNLTPRATQVMAFAREEAVRLNSESLGGEHLLLGLLALGQGVAVNVLQKAGLNLENLRAAAEKLAAQEPNRKGSENLGYAPQLKAVFSLANRERRRLNHTYLGTEHILLGILGPDDAGIAKLWSDFGINREQISQEILRELDPNFSVNQISGQTPSAPKEHAAMDTKNETPYDPESRWPRPDPLDFSKRYDVYCVEHGQTLVYRNVLFKSAKGLYMRRPFDPSSVYLELELLDGKAIFLPKHSVFKFCEPGAMADGERIPPPKP